MSFSWNSCGTNVQVPYGALRLTAASPPQSFAEPMTLAEAKGFLNLDESFVVDDDMLEAMIPAAREIAEIFQGRDLVEKQWDLWLDSWRQVIELRDPLTSVDLVRYRDSAGNYTTLTEGADYIVDTSKQPGVVMPAYNTSWPSFTPWPSSSILVRFESGPSLTDPFWSDSGSRIKIGMRYLISGWYENRIPSVIGNVSELPWSIKACFEYGALGRMA
jgi:uncharacterized phiE125 gp8 family phage protein